MLPKLLKASLHLILKQEEKVDELVKKAAEAGGSIYGDPKVIIADVPAWFCA